MDRRSLGWLIRVAAVAAVVSLPHAFHPAWAAVAAPPAEQELGDSASEPSAEGGPLRVSMEFQNVSLKEILKAFSLQTGLNIIAAGDIGDQPMTLYLEDVTILDALDQILHAGNLTYEHPNGSDIFVVKRVPETAQTITRVYRLKYARVSKAALTKSIEAFGTATQFEAAQTTARLTGSSAPSAGGSSSSGENSTPGVDSVIKRLLTDQGTVVVDERTNALIVTDVPENFPRIEAAIVALDAKTQQVLIDVEFIETQIGTTRDIGVSWSSGNDGSLASLTPGYMASRYPFNLISRVDKTVPFIADPDENAAKGGLFDSPGYTLSTLSAEDAQAVFKALQSDSNTKVLARPKVLTLDNESAIVRLSKNQTIGFDSTTTTSGGSSTVQVTPLRETTGIILSVTPQVNADGFITMLVEPSITKVVPAEVTPPTGSGDVVDPKTRSTRTLVRIRDGDTLVVGGLIDRTNETTVRKVPYLSSIPIVGKAFESTSKNDNSTELMVFVTPSTVKDGPGYASPAAGTAVQAAARRPESAVRTQAGAAQKGEAMDDALNAFERTLQPTLSD